jgi:hypothetical protein
LIYKYFLHRIGTWGIAGRFALEIIVAKYAWLTLMTHTAQVTTLSRSVYHFSKFIKVVGPELCLGHGYDTAPVYIDVIGAV